FTGVYQEPLRPELEKLYVLKALQNPLFFTEGNATTRIGPYLAARLPSLISLPGARDELIQAANKGLQSLARRTENAFLLEQLQDYHEAGLPVHLDTQSIEMWIGFRVKREGLLVDPLAYAEGFDCRVRQGYERAYERYIGEGYEQKTERGQFAKQVLIAYFKHRGEWGWTGVAAALEADSSDIPPEEKFQVIRNLIHGLAIPTIKLNTKRSFHQPSRITVERSINTPAIRFFEGILALPFSDEQKNHLTQEAYALYALQNSVFLDTDLLEGLLPLQLDHPSVIAARARLTKSCLVEERPITIDEPFHMRPALLPPSEWTEAQFEEYTTVIKHLNERHYKEIIQEFREWHETDKSLANRLMEIFWQWREGHLDDSRLEQTLIMNNAKIQIFRKNSGEFQEAFEGLLAEHISRGEWTLEQAQRRFRNPEEEFSLRMCEEIVITTVRTGNWFAIEALLKRYPDREKELIIWVKREVGERLAAELKRSTNSPTQPWLAYVIAHHSDVLIVEQSKEDFPWNEYQICLSHLYGKDKLPSELFLKIPGIDLRHPVLQEAIATDVLLNILNKGLKVVAAEAAFIDWANPEIQALSDRVSQSYFPSLKVLKARETEPGALESDLGKLRLFQETTGYFVSDPRFWDLHRDDRISGIGEGIEHWERLASLLGEKPGAREAIRKAAQDILDRLCKLGGGVIAEFAALQKEYHLTPSDESLRLAVVDGLRPGRSLTRSVELLKALGRSVEFSVENIRQIPLTEPRAEALIYTTLLPKSGPDRAAAEKAYKERSPLAALIPQLLAIQGPTKRDEFCPYVHGFTPFMGQITFREEVQNKGLLLYFKEFGMRYSPLLAWSIIELVERLEGVVSVRGSHHLDALNTLLGVGEEKWTLEQYLQKMHELIATIRQTILEDVSLDPRVEKSALGMELFNAVVPHTGSYQSVEDRPALLALTRVNQEGLVLGPWYTPGSKLVNVAEQEQVSLQDQGGSLVDRQIAARKEQLKKKYQDETMQRFVRGWEEALEMLRLEPTAQSRPYWFAFIRDRFQRQLVTLEEKQAETENIKGKAALEKKMERLRQMDTRIAALLNRDSDPEFATPSVETLFEELQSLFVTTNGKVDRVELEAQVGDIARVFTIALLREHSPAHYEAVCEAQADKTERASPALLTAWERWFREEYLEHFAGFNPEVDQPLTSSTRFLLQKLWRIDGLEQDILKMQSG
ncbi:hypothetical protein KBA73_05375, partial [Patescibacteria group bacterium]|nr:hypothetical protein [Patescibacteria group bacterium]